MIRNIILICNTSRNKLTEVEVWVKINSNLQGTEKGRYFKYCQSKTLDSYIGNDFLESKVSRKLYYTGKQITFFVIHLKDTGKRRKIPGALLRAHPGLYSK